MPSEELEVRVPSGADVQALSRDQWVELLVEEMIANATATAGRLVDDMIVRGALAVGPRRRWTVVHDDPGAVMRYEIPDIYAPTPEIAMRRGTFLAIMADPHATMPNGWGGRPPTEGEREQVARSLTEHAARWCTVTETTEVETDGEAG